MGPTSATENGPAKPIYPSVWLEFTSRLLHLTFSNTELCPSHAMDDIPIDPALLEEEEEIYRERLAVNVGSDEADADAADGSSGFDEDSDDAYNEGDEQSAAGPSIPRPTAGVKDDTVFR